MNRTTISKEQKSTSTVKDTSRFPGQRPEVLKGNFAAAEAARLCRVGFVPAYPITPQTSIVEQLSDMVATGKLDATYINMDSEHSVFAAAMGAALGGERVFTATAGQGLFYAHEVLQAISRFRLPMVVCNVGRPSIPWNIWSDQSDSLSQRDTGWIQYYGESAQEVLDTIIQGYRLTEDLNIPVMVVLDAFYQSHTSENVWVPDQEMVDAFLPAPPPRGMQIDLSEPKAFGGLVAPEHYNKLNYAYWQNMRRVETRSEEIARAFAVQFGRSYHNVEAVNIWSGTKLVLVAISSISSTVRGVIQRYPEVGLLKIRLMHPFPKASVRRALAPLPKKAVIACVERNYLGGEEGALRQEMQRTLYGHHRNPVFGFFAGVGGKDVPPETIERIIEKALRDPEPVSWVDV